MKILYVTTVGGTMRFFVDLVEKLLREGHTVDIACNHSKSMVPAIYKEMGCQIYEIPTARRPFHMGNLKSIWRIKELSKTYDVVHCHTPVAAMCTRIACRKALKQGTKVVYMAHGFHFYQGAPVKNWLLYYPMERFCSYLTDVLITINKEDYELALRKMKARRIEYVPGVGINLDKVASEIADVSIDKARPEGCQVLLSVGELNRNKNHETVIRALKDMDNLNYMIAGRGILKEHLQKVIDELGMTDRVRLLGYRTDIMKLCLAVDYFIFPSYREGLSVAVMEAMACGLPVICSNIRGNTELIDANGGELFDPASVEDCKRAISEIQKKDIREMGFYNMEKVKKFAVESVNEKMYELLCCSETER